MRVSRTMRTAVQAVAALGVLIAVLLWMSGACGRKIAPGMVEVEGVRVPDDAPTATVAEETVAVIEEAAGTVQAERKTLVSSRIMAVIRAVKVRAGEEVAEGDTLIELDAREPGARAAEAARAVDAAEAMRRRRASDLERARRLLAEGVVSESEFDQAEAAAKVAAAEVEAARRTLEAAEIGVSYAAIRSPVSGRVVDRLADAGDTAVPGKPLLALYDPAALRIEVPVRESLVARLQIGDTLEVRMGTAQETLRGTVDEIVPQAEAGSRTFLVKVGLPKREGLYTGMFGRVLIPAGERRRVLVPAAALERVGQLTFASVVDAERRLTRRLVTLGPAGAEGRREVLSGLRAGETVLLAGPSPVEP